ncbi:MAG: hypothetical protein OEV89_03180 [Desulfobulbaceae bacterium]|nr:hypothetical protein [Desulfobulbaceae bacterium]
MKINETNTGAATFAMKKAMEMPKTLVNLVQNSTADAKNTLGTMSPALQPKDISMHTGKGKIVDIVA